MVTTPPAVPLLPAVDADGIVWLMLPASMSVSLVASSSMYAW